ncbi:MAG: hypothetical protein K0U37_01450 [Gammaproteobacteria bacterium]|nr:hypothetical protein [Gammaproteobacteria bacterium]
MSEASQSFPERTVKRLISKWDDRAKNATKIYRFFPSPSTPLDANASWFNPLNRGRFEAFENASDFASDIESLILKPMILFGLRLFETLKIAYYLLAFLAHALTASPIKAIDAGIDGLEALVAGHILDCYIALEVMLQLASITMRCVLSVPLLFDLGKEEAREAEDKADMNVFSV